MSIDYGFGFLDEIEQAKRENWPVLLPVGTIEYHGHHCAYGTDTLVAMGMIQKVAEKRDVVVMPPIWYGVASYAVAGPDLHTVDVSADAFENYMYCIFKSLLEGGFRKIFPLICHQTDGYMPMTLACMKAAKKAIFEYTEEHNGRGWWGKNENGVFFDGDRVDDNPFDWIRVVRGLMPADMATTEEEQKMLDGDHAGIFETSQLKVLYPEAVKEERIGDNTTEWYTKSAKDMSIELGEKIVNGCLEELLKEIDK